MLFIHLFSILDGNNYDNVYTTNQLIQSNEGTSSRFSRNFEAGASEFVGNLKTCRLVTA